MLILLLHSMNGILADLHPFHHGGGGSSDTPLTPSQEAVFTAFATVIIAGVILSGLNLTGGALLVFLTRRKLAAIWLVPALAGERRTQRQTSPASENFTALPSNLPRICCSRWASA